MMKGIHVCCGHVRNMFPGANSSCRMLLVEVRGSKSVMYYVYFGDIKSNTATKISECNGNLRNLNRFNCNDICLQKICVLHVISLDTRYFHERCSPDMIYDSKVALVQVTR